MFMILYTVQVTGLQLRDPAAFNGLLLGLGDILYFLTPIFASLRSMAVLSSRAQERRSHEIRARSARERAAKPREKLLPPQSPRRFSALARLYYLARPTKTAMLPRGGGGGVLPYITYTGMCRPTGS